jgi:hypothetical protein
VTVTFGVLVVKKLSLESLSITIYLASLSLFSPVEGITESSLFYTRKRLKNLFLIIGVYIRKVRKLIGAIELSILSTTASSLKSPCFLIFLS